MSTEDHLQIKNQVCFPLYALSREIIGAYRPFLDALEFTYPQYLVLMVLWESEPLSVNSIGDRLHLDSGTLSPLLKKMEAKNLIFRKRKTEDERIVEIFLTEKGREIKADAAAIPGKLMYQLKVTEEEIIQLKEISNKILNRISQKSKE